MYFPISTWSLYHLLVFLDRQVLQCRSLPTRGRDAGGPLVVPPTLDFTDAGATAAAGTLRVKEVELLVGLWFADGGGVGAADRLGRGIGSTRPNQLVCEGCEKVLLVLVLLMEGL